MLLHEDLTYVIREAATEVHRAFGPGLLESAYQACLSRKLTLRGVLFQREVALPVLYKGVQLECGYRIDFVIADSVIVEVKCVEALLPVHEAQLLTYLRLSGKRVGLLINFHEALLKEGIMRRVL